MDSLDHAYVQSFVFLFCPSLLALPTIITIITIIIIIVLAVSGLHCCVQAFCSCGERGLLFVAARELLIAVASLVF